MAANSRFAVATHIMVGLGYLPDHSPFASPEKGNWISSDLLAESVNTNPVVVRRLLGVLKIAGLVVTQQGKNGGVALARDPEKITLLDIFHAVGEESVFAFNPNPPNPRCPVSLNMFRLIDPVFRSVSRALEKDLDLTRLSDLIMGIR
ncbi:MAG: Rrf2 family transcriptional regulator [Leptospirales bacterium]